MINDIPVATVDSLLKTGMDYGLDPTVLRQIPSSYILPEQVAMMENLLPQWRSMTCAYIWSDCDATSLPYYYQSILESVQ